ncbi:MAG: hypothetical protein ABFD50_00335 [Smithella sp.]
MSTIETILSTIKDTLTASALREHIAMLKDQILILEKKLLACESHVTRLNSENNALKTENLELKMQWQAIEQGNKREADADICQHCNQPAGQLLEIKPHRLFGDVGYKERFYICRNCGKNYDREQAP